MTFASHAMLQCKNFLDFCLPLTFMSITSRFGCRVSSLYDWPDDSGP